MNTTITLPDGGSATIRDPKKVTERQRRPVTRLQMRLAASSIGQLLARKDEVKDGPDDDEATKAAHAAARDALDAELTALIINDPSALALLDDLNDALIVALVESVDVDGTGAKTFEGDAVLDVPGPVYDVLKTETAKHVTDIMPTFTPNPSVESPTPPSDS